MPDSDGRPIEASETDSAVLGVVRSITGRAWIWQHGEDRIALALAQRLGLPEIVGRLLAARGIDPDTAADFLDPTLRALLPDPSRLLDMDAAAARLAEAARHGETVAVFGDYDVDGACSAALLTTVLRALGCQVLTHIPDRIAEGYGPNAPALHDLADRGAGLVVCVDCGTAADAALQTLSGRADIIVLDHHKAEGPPPSVLATVNPNRLDDSSGLGGLCATAVVFLAAVATLRTLRRTGFFAARPEPRLLDQLDLVALATVCDVMPLTGLNRALVAQGLKVMAKRARPGISALLDVTLSRDHPSAFTCGFALGPRINAGGRIGAADLGLRLLLADDAFEARVLAERLDETNRRRRDVEAGVLEAAMAQAQAQAAAGHAALLVVAPNWHPGVVGIVAGRLREAFNRPACVGGLAEGVIRGSGRSVPGLDLGATVIAARQAGLLATGGGHALAAGFSLTANCVGAFHAFLDERLAAASDLPAVSGLGISATLAVPGATTDLAQQVARLAPFGAGNLEPVFVLPRCRMVRAERVGREANTLRGFVEGETGGRLKTMLFRAGDTPLARLLQSGGTPLHLAGHLRAESWNGASSVSFVVVDAAPA